MTNESGNFTFPNLTPGNYTVSVESKGFKKETRANVDVVVNTATRVDLVPSARKHNGKRYRDRCTPDHAN